LFAQSQELADLRRYLTDITISWWRVSEQINGSGRPSDASASQSLAQFVHAGFRRVLDSEPRRTSGCDGEHAAGDLSPRDDATERASVHRRGQRLILQAGLRPACAWARLRHGFLRTVQGTRRQRAIRQVQHQ